MAIRSRGTLRGATVTSQLLGQAASLKARRSLTAGCTNETREIRQDWEPMPRFLHGRSKTEVEHTLERLPGKPFVAAGGCQAQESGLWSSSYPPQVRSIAVLRMPNVKRWQ